MFEIWKLSFSYKSIKGVLRQVHSEKIFVMTSILTELVKMVIFIKANPLFLRKYWSKTPYISVGDKWRLNEGGALNVLDGVGELQLFLVGFTSCPCRWTSQLLFDLFICRSFKKIYKNIFFNKLRFIEAWSKLVSWFRLITQTVKLIFTSQGWQSMVNRETPPIVTHG